MRPLFRGRDEVGYLMKKINRDCAVRRMVEWDWWFIQLWNGIRQSWLYMDLRLDCFKRRIPVRYYIWQLRSR